MKVLRKPTAAAGAVNRLVREHRGEVEQFLRAAAELRDAQFSGKGALVAATTKEHEALELLTDVGGEAVRQTLLAAAVDDDAAQQLLEARLERELEPRGFGTLLAHAPSAAATDVAPPKGAIRTRARRTQPEKKTDDSAARSRLGDAEAALNAAETEERDARRHWEAARSELERARAAVEGAQRDLDRLQGR